MKYVTGTRNTHVESTSMWFIYHNGSCESFYEGWMEFEKKAIQNWYEMTSERHISSNKLPNGGYSIDDEKVRVFDVVILHREDIEDNQN